MLVCCIPSFIVVLLIFVFLFVGKKEKKRKKKKKENENSALMDAFIISFFFSLSKQVMVEKKGKK
jgi:uncharacterized membrane protein